MYAIKDFETLAICCIFTAYIYCMPKIVNSNDISLKTTQ